MVSLSKAVEGGIGDLRKGNVLNPLFKLDIFGPTDRKHRTVQGKI